MPPVKGQDQIIIIIFWDCIVLFVIVCTFNTLKHGLSLAFDLFWWYSMSQVPKWLIFYINLLSGITGITEGYMWNLTSDSNSVTVKTCKSRIISKKYYHLALISFVDTSEVRSESQPQNRNQRPWKPRNQRQSQISLFSFLSPCYGLLQEPSTRMVESNKYIQNSVQNLCPNIFSVIIG